jgi:SAM-dependent methyltransferase
VNKIATRAAGDKRVDDPYLTGSWRWWHLAKPSPELLAAEGAGAIGSPAVAVDLGCGLGTEIGYLAARGWRGLGLDLSAAALTGARSRHRNAVFACADVTNLPLQDGAADLLLDRGCFHYLAEPARARYAREAWRVLRPGGRLLLRMCLNSAGVPNGLDESTISEAFGGWHLADLHRTELVSDTRSMPAITALIIRPAEPRTDGSQSLRQTNEDHAGHN